MKAVVLRDRRQDTRTLGCESVATARAHQRKRLMSAHERLRRVRRRSASGEAREFQT